MDKERFRGRKYGALLGYDEGFITRVAKEVGVSRPTVYRQLFGKRKKKSRLHPDKLALLELLCNVPMLKKKLNAQTINTNDVDTADANAVTTQAVNLLNTVVSFSSSGGEQ